MSLLFYLCLFWFQMFNVCYKEPNYIFSEVKVLLLLTPVWFGCWKSAAQQRKALLYVAELLRRPSILRGKKQQNK